MDKLNKILYIVITVLLGGLGIHKFINGRIIPGIVHIVISIITLGIGWLIPIIEAIYDGVKRPANEAGEIEIPKGFFDFLN